MESPAGRRPKPLQKERLLLQRGQHSKSKDIDIPTTTIVSRSNENVVDTSSWSIMSNLSINGDDRQTEQDSYQPEKSSIKDLFLDLLINKAASCEIKSTDARDDSNESNDIYKIKNGLSHSLSDEYNPITERKSYSIMRLREDDDSYNESINIKQSPSFIEYSSSSQSDSCNGWIDEERSDMYSHKEDRISTLLFEQIKSKSWSGALQRIQSHPEETKIWVNGESSESFWKYLPIHIASMFNCPKEVIRQLIETNPDSALSADFRGRLPIHIACQHPCVPVEIVQLLLEAYPESISVKDNFGLQPVHIALASGFIEAKHMLLNTENIDLQGAGRPKGRLSELLKKRKWKHI